MAMLIRFWINLAMAIVTFCSLAEPLIGQPLTKIMYYKNGLHTTICIALATTTKAQDTLANLIATCQELEAALSFMPGICSIFYNIQTTHYIILRTSTWRSWLLWWPVFRNLQ